MNLGRTVFSQLIGFLPDREFRRCVDRYKGDSRHKEEGFPCWDQFLCLSFAQLTYRESLRDIQAGLRSSPVAPDCHSIPVASENNRNDSADGNGIVHGQYQFSSPQLFEGAANLGSPGRGSTAFRMWPWASFERYRLRYARARLICPSKLLVWRSLCSQRCTPARSSCSLAA